MSRTGPKSVTKTGPPPNLRALADAFEVPLDEPRLQALRGFCDLLLRWGARINLTGARSTADLVADHLPDAFALARLLPGPRRVLDVGSGGGLPALPLALLRPALTLALCEPIAKKVAFLRTALRELGLADRVQIHPIRVEALPTLSRPFDVALSRATFPPAEWLALGERLVAPGGQVFALTTPAAARAAARATDRRHPYLNGERLLLERIVPRETPAPAPGSSSREV
jgi:16S rRNA (guanine527-N7)-methyltransferase